MRIVSFLKNIYIAREKSVMISFNFPWHWCFINFSYMLFSKRACSLNTISKYSSMHFVLHYFVWLYGVIPMIESPF
jgi:hypothetical protein